jgi:hypothetical protein
MSTVRNCFAAVACAALLSVAGTTAAGAQGTARCNHLARITQRLEAKEARLAARSSIHARSLDAKVSKVQAKITQLQTLCAG